MRAGLFLAAMAAAAVALGGCKSGAEQRASVPFHVNAVLVAIDNLAKDLPSRQVSRIGSSARRLAQTISSLPNRVVKKQPADLERSQAAARAAVEFCNKEVMPLLQADRVGNLDLQAANAKLDELRKLVSQVSSDK
jgi:hypothetical protein